jgi:alpha,alpha-trehalase
MVEAMRGAMAKCVRGLLGVFVFSIVAHVTVAGQASAPKQSGPAPMPILEYMHQAWDTLSRSMVDCKSLHDVKVTTAPILYLPAGMREPASVTALRSTCGVDVERLPRKITHVADVMPQELKRPGLLYLPNKYVVPGGRFNEMYGWDSYFIILGLLTDGRAEMAKGMVENFEFEIENYGAGLNANRTYFLTRSQPPLLGEMIREVHASPAGASKEWLEHAYDAAQKDYALWVTPAHQAGNTGLARYFDFGDGPVLEMADDSTYYPDAIRWMLAHQDAGGAYLVPATMGDAASCDRKLTAVCAHAEVDGMRLSRDFYKGDRAMRESGFDTSFRFGPFSGSTHHFAPVCLNSLLYKYELDMAGFAKELGKKGDAASWTRRAAARKAAINRYLWDASTGLYEDYDFTTAKRSSYLYATVFYPLWAGLSSPQQAAGVEKAVPRLEAEHGLAMSDTISGMQWDRPFGWAPETWFAVEGLRASGFKVDGDRLADEFRATVETNYVRAGNVREKYNMETGSTDVVVAAGYKTNATGFGWTNGVYLRLLPRR